MLHKTGLKSLGWPRSPRDVLGVSHGEAADVSLRESPSGSLPLLWPWVRIFVIACLALGVFFRFYNLGHKVYWSDETMTSLRISGYTTEQLVTEAFNGRNLTVGEMVQIYQVPDPSLPLNDTLTALASHPEHSPLFYLMARYWSQGWPNPAVATRSLAALISLCLFPAIYWLCQELFQSSWVGWGAIAVVAVSPLQVLYAQEARQYSLWALTVVLASAALLRAMRVKSVAAWGLYTLTLTLSFYTHLFSGLVALGHGLYVAAIAAEALWQHWQLNRGDTPGQERGVGNRSRVPTWGNWRVLLAPIGTYLLASGVAVILFSPWLWIVITRVERVQEVTEWVTADRDNLFAYWLLNLNRLFFDMNQGTSLWNPLLYLTLALAVYAVYFVWCTTLPRIWLFVVCQIGVTSLGLILPDLLLGGRRSTISRYLIPCHIAVQLAVAYLLTLKVMGSPSAQATPSEGLPVSPLNQGYSRQATGLRTQLLAPISALRTGFAPAHRWRQVVALVTLSGVLSCLVSAHVAVWWHKSPTKSRHNPLVAEVINRATHPLVISNEPPTLILPLCHLLKPTVTLQLVQNEDMPTIPEGYSDVFIYRSSDYLHQALQEKMGLELLPAAPHWLMRLTMPSVTRAPGISPNASPGASPSPQPPAT